MRNELLRRGLRLEGLTIGWNALEALIAIGAGYVAGSVALVGFGLDSVIESISGVALYHRLSAELRDAHAADSMRYERRALLFVGVSFFAIAAYVLFQAGVTLSQRREPDESAIGIVLAFVSLVIMPILGRLKLRTGRALASRALVADSKETFVCAYLSFALLLGLGLNAWLGWWWADPVAALAMLPLIVREGWEATREAIGRESHSGAET